MSAPIVWPREIPSSAGPAPAALAVFERALQDVQRHRYASAVKILEALVADFPGETAVLDRARVYLNLCRRELQRRPAAPSSLEERLTLATAALNNSDDAVAERLVREVLADVPEHDLALYLLAAVHARRGDAESALEQLRRAMAVSPDVSAQARHDADFEILREMSAFREMLDTAGPSGTLNGSTRADERGRSGR